MKEQPGRRTLVYYFAFPHYRRAILESLQQDQRLDVSLWSGSLKKADISTLRADEMPGLHMVKSWSVGPFIWDCGVLAAARQGKFHTIILGPATTSLSTWAILVWARMTDRRVLLWGQCGRPHDRSVKRYVQEIMNRLASGLLVYGTSEATSAAELGISPSKVHVVRNASGDGHNDSLLVSRLSSSTVLRRMLQTAERFKRDGRLRLVYSGRIIPFKRVEILLRAARLARVKYPSLSVDIIGDGVDLPRLKAAFNDGFITYHGALYGEAERAAIFADATLVISPWHLGLLALDALRFGVPVLVPNNPMNASEVECLTMGLNAVSFEAGSPQAIVDAIGEWLDLVWKIDHECFLAARDSALEAWTASSVARLIAEIVIT